MTVADMLILFIVGLLAHLIINHLWLAKLAKKFYLRQLKRHTEIKDDTLIPYVPAVILLISLTTLINIAIVIISETRAEALFFGTALGACLYLFHNLFNLTLLKEHSVTFALVDSAFGIILTSIVVLIMYTTKQLIM